MMKRTADDRRIAPIWIRKPQYTPKIKPIAMQNGPYGMKTMEHATKTT